MFEDKKKKIEDIVLWIGKDTGTDIKAIVDCVETGKFKFVGNINQYDIYKNVKSVITNYLSGELDACFPILRNTLLFIVKNYKIGSSTSAIRLFCNTALEACDLIDICDKYIAGWNQEKKSELERKYYFDDKFCLNASDVVNIKNNIDSKYFHLYQYRCGGNVPNTTKFKIIDTIVATGNIDNIIHKSYQEDTWNVTVGLFLEKKIDLSYFVITFTLNNNIYVLTDRPTYTNSDQINKLRNGGRRFSEDRESNLDFLPYVLIDKVIENRKAARTLSKEDDIEIWTFPIREYFGEILYYVIKFTIEKIQSGYSIQKLIVADTLLLTDGATTVDLNDNSSFSKIGADEMDELIKELYDRKETSLCVKTSDLIAEIGMSTTLMTVEEVGRNAQYIAHKRIAEQIRKEKYGELVGDNGALFHEMQKQKKELLSMFADKIVDMEPYIFSGNRVHLHDIDHPKFANTFASNSTFRYKSQFINIVESYNIPSKFFKRLGIECSKKCGHNANSNYLKTLSFERYTEIMTMLGISRDELPHMFKYYLSHAYTPYSGNSILDNVNPEYETIRNDFVSRHNANAFQVSLPYCGICSRKLYKKHKIAEDTVIVISSKQNKVLEVLPLEEFETKYINHAEN